MAQTSDSSKQSNRSRIPGILQLAGIAAIVIVAIVLARAPDRIERDASAGAGIENPPPAAVSVLTAPRQEDFTLPVRFTGNVTLEERITVMSEARGRAIWVSEKFRSGETIDANELLVKIDPAEYLSRIEEIQAQLRLHRSKAAEAGDEHKATRMQARTELLQARLEQARLKLGQTEISFPYELHVTRSDIAVGELAGPFEYVGPDAANLGAGYRTEALQVSGPVEPYRIADLEPLIGRPAQIRIAGDTFAAALERVSNAVSPETRMLQLFFKFAEDTPTESLPLPGMFAEIEMQGQTYENAFVLPLAARQSQSNALVVENDVLAVRSPNTLALTSDHWIVEPFDTGSGVVVGNFFGLSAGSAVKALPVSSN